MTRLLIIVTSILLLSCSNAVDLTIYNDTKYDIKQVALYADNHADTIIFDNISKKDNSYTKTCKAAYAYEATRIILNTGDTLYTDVNCRSGDKLFTSGDIEYRIKNIDLKTYRVYLTGRHY